MILFQKRFLAGIQSGAITMTFRAWKTARVKPGGRYRCHPIGVLEVDAVDVVSAADITEEEAALCGFATRAELFAYMGERVADALEQHVVRVRFHHGGDGDRVGLALDDQLSPVDRRAIAKKLADMDRRSAHGPWTKKTLGLIAKHPRIAASKLALKVHRETKEFKADVVKLKRLGLTQSFEVGYEVSPRGKAFISRK